jgi:threonyl-tRNA synthetase
VPEDLAAIEKKMKELAAADPDERQMRPRDQARVLQKRGETLKVQLIDEKTEGQSEVSVYDRARHLRRLLRRPARPFVRPAQGLSPALDVERLLEGRREERADAAHLRHGVLQRQSSTPT